MLDWSVIIRLCEIIYAIWIARNALQTHKILKFRLLDLITFVNVTSCPTHNQNFFDVSVGKEPQKLQRVLIKNC